ncbi:MAG TPA: DUF2065 domain-containing protein [Alphaproteobacteria bacterium]|nr:DUF2065 domain-containing protein [Alphaproteobacteria bacterium]
MTDLLTAFGLVLVIEGILYALFPEVMRRAVMVMLGQQPMLLRLLGVGAAALGVAVVWLVRR